MLITTLLNHLEKHKGFIYGKARMVTDNQVVLRLEIPVLARKNSHGLCSSCGDPGPTYDHLKERHFQYVPLWGVPVILLYALRRVECRHCGIKVESVPWSTGKSPLTRTLSLFLADWAKLLSWQDVALRFKVNWHQVYGSVRYVSVWL